ITDFIDSEYTLHLVKELTRTTKPNGVIFGVGSPGLELKLKDHPAFYQPTALDSSYDTDFFLVRKRQ
ncbi:hypothetical protein KY362_03660, partial [Candidatus Woesearchaeota archaeon]|nr:hypothetical protein [Candidatus Woesearchaeota archaeon]